MNLNILLEMTQGMNTAGDVANKLMSSKANNKEFTGMFDNFMSKVNDTNKSDNEIAISKSADSKKDEISDFTTSDKKDIVSETIDVIKDEISDVKDEIISQEENIIDDEDDEVNEEVCEAFYALLLMLQNNPEDLKVYFNEKEDGTFEINMENLDLLKSDFKNFISNNDLNIDFNIDENLFEEKLNLSLDKVIELGTNFALDKVNKEVTLVNMFTKENEDIDMSYELETSDVVLDETETIEIAAETVASDENIDENFNILKDVINEMVDEVKVTHDVKKEVEVEEKISQVEVLDNTKDKKENNDIVIVEDENVLEVKEEVSDDKVDKVIEKELDTNEDLSDKTDKIDKKDHKVKNGDRVLEAKPKTVFEVNNKLADKVVPEDLSDVLDDNLMNNFITDRFLETVNVTKQMVKHVELNLSEGVQEMNIKLDPENLGKVNLKIVTENGLVQAKFEAENQRVKEIIESNLSLLKESLERRGVEVSGLEVSVGQNMNQNYQGSNLDETRKIALGKNPHKILGKGIKIFTSNAEINNSELKRRGLYMTRSQVNYIA